MEIKLEPLKFDHAEVSFAWRNIPEIWKYTFNKPTKIITLKDEQEWMLDVLFRTDEYRFAILADNLYVGNTYLTQLQNSSARFHIFIGDKNFWGKGVAKKATFLILHFAFKELSLNSVELMVHVDNIRAVKLYRLIGFQKISRKGSQILMNISRTDFING